MKKFLYKRNLITILIVNTLISFLLAISLYQNKKTMNTSTENNYNMAFYEVVNHMQDVQSYLAKSLVSKSSENGAETLTNVWREANLTQTYLSMLPIESQELENTEKFLNQVGDYSYSLSRKNIKKVELSEEDLKNLKDLHELSVELSNTLNQLSEDLNSGRISWKDLTTKKISPFAQQVSNISKDSFSNLQDSFKEYSGLIYDGAYSDHLLNGEKKALTGKEISEDEAENRVRNIIGENKIKELKRLGLSDNSNIAGYNFGIKDNDDNNINISISHIGGHLISINSDRNVMVETITQEEASQIGQKYLANIGFPNMKETYYLKQEGIVTINFAYNQNGVIMYPDLIKVKVALDNGEVVGVETTGYLNSHQERDISNIKISKEEAKKKINKDLEIKSEGLAVIPTEWQTEILCYEFKGKIEDTDFLVYINAQSGDEEDILVITNTPNGTLTM